MTTKTKGRIDDCNRTSDRKNTINYFYDLTGESIDDLTGESIDDLTGESIDDLLHVIFHRFLTHSTTLASIGQ